MANAAIAASERYRDARFPVGVRGTPQEGVLPLGADPQSGLWEFLYVLSGREPARDEEGRFRRQASGAHALEESDSEGTGVVLVLIPGGTFWMSVQKTDPSGHNFAPAARVNESTVHPVTLCPYLISKYELTQG